MKHLMIAFLAFCAGGVAAVWLNAPVEPEETGYTQADRAGMERLVKESCEDHFIAVTLAKPARMTEAERAKAMQYLFQEDSE